MNIQKMKMNYFTNFVKKYSRIFLIQQQKRYLLMTSPARKQRNQQQNNPNNPLLFTTIDGGSFIQCASTIQNHTVLVLSKQTKLYLSGVFAFQTLYGHVEVNGYLFAPKKFNASHFMPISIPNGQFPTVFSIRDDISDKLNVEQVQSRLREFVSDPSKVIPFVQENYPVAILLIKLEMDIASKFIAQQMVHFFRNTFQVTKFIAEQMPFNIFQSFGRSLGYKLYLANKSGDDGHMPLGEIEAHQNVLNRLREVVKRINFKLASEKKCIVFIVGNKGVGKSTAARFLANSLNSGQGEGRVFQGECRVFLLDSDVGQSEMNPAGCISLNEVNRPMIGAPFVSQNCTFQNSYFFGSNSPTVDFDFYIKLVARLVDQFHNIAQEDANTPSVLIVNTVGWIEDLGYDLMLRMLSTVKPSILINLALDSENSLNFLVPENYRKIHCRIERKPRMSPLNDAPSPNSLTPAQLRHCQVAAYFAQLFLRTERQSTNFLRLSELQPYRLRFCSTSIYIHPELRHVDDKFMLCNLNYTMVALCKIEEGFEKYFEKKQILADSSLPTRLLLRKDLPLEFSSSWEDGQLLDDSADDILPVERSSPPMLRCFGFGLIRAIHPQRKLFYILTPVEPSVLPQINVLAFGHGLNTPEMLYELNPREAAPYLVELETGLQENYKKLYSPLRNVTSARRGCGPPPTKRKS